MPRLCKHCNLWWIPALFWESGIFCNCQAKSVHVTSPNKNLGAESLMGFPEQKHWHVSLHFLLVKKEAHLVCPLMGGREHLKPINGFLQTPTVSLFLTDPVVYLFAIINLSCECEYMLSPVSLSSEALDIWMVLGNKTPLKQRWSPKCTFGWSFGFWVENLWKPYKNVLLALR